MEKELTRYARHITLDEVGETGQKKLLNSKILVIGAGGLSSPILMYLASSGIGTIGIVDFDTVDKTNLHRQIIHNEDTLENAKVNSAKDTIEKLNSNVVVNVYRERLNQDNITDIFKNYDIIVDGCDNYATRYLTNEYAIKLNKPLISGALNKYSGQILTVSKNSPCYKCVFPNQPNADEQTTCENVGVLATTAGVVGTMQAMEVIKVILGIGENLIGKLQIIDTLNNEYKILTTSKNKDCDTCN